MTSVKRKLIAYAPACGEAHSLPEFLRRRQMSYRLDKGLRFIGFYKKARNAIFHSQVGDPRQTTDNGDAATSHPFQQRERHAFESRRMDK
jgi:hypothetical protein